MLLPPLFTDRGSNYAGLMTDVVKRATALLSSPRFIWSIIALGITLRVVRFAANRSLWGDEGALALNIVNKPLPDLFGRLDFLQGAPAGYLAAQEMTTALLGDTEPALRLVALLSGIAALVVFAFAARRLVDAPAAGLAIVLFALSEPLVYYSSEVKQYATDTAVATILLLGAVAVDWRRWRPAALALVTAAGSVLIWFSHPSLIMLPSLIVALLVARYLEGDTQSLRRIAASATVMSVSGAMAYLVSRRNTSAVAEAALGPGGGADGITSPLSNLWDAVADPVGIAYSATGLAFAIAFLGMLALLRRSLEAALVVVGPIAATLVAAGLDLYPFSGRFVLFLVPSAALLVGAGLWALFHVAADRRHVFAAVSAGLILGYPSATAVKNLVSPPGHEEVKTVLRHIESKWQAGDSLYLWFQSQYPFRYYAECRECDVLGPEGPASVVWPPEPQALSSHYALETHSPRLYVSGELKRLDEYARDLEPLSGKRRVWLLFSSSWNDDFVRYVLDCRGVRLDERRAERAVAYLYDLATPSRHPGSCA